MSDRIPPLVIQAFPQLEELAFLRCLAAPVPLVPDTTFSIYANNSRGFFALITTDHVDPYNQCDELKKISGSNKFEVTGFIKPFCPTDELIDISTIDKHNQDWVVKYTESAYPIYYYLTKIKRDS